LTGIFPSLGRCKRIVLEARGGAAILSHRLGFPAWSVVASLVLALSGCAVKQTTVIQPFAVPAPPREATLDELIANLNSQADDIRTLQAKVDLETTTGSVYSGVINEYHDVQGYILIQKPSLIRIIGQAPVVGTNIFDMVSDADEFRLYIPSKEKFIVGKTSLHRASENKLENLRPQHILDAMLVPAISPQDHCYLEEAEEGTSKSERRYYIVSVLGIEPNGTLELKRKIWFDRSDLEMARLQLYEPGGRHVEDAQYSGYLNFEGIRYPTRILVKRPIEDYQLAITIVNIPTIDQPIDPAKFTLQKPAGAELVDLDAEPSKSSGGGPPVTRGGSEIR
jgi:outer membrane lipoprotein-sorting protein